MRREFFSIIFCALVSIFILFIEPDTNTIFNIIALLVVAVVDGIYIYKINQIDIEKTPEKIKTVYVTGIALMVVSVLLVVIEGIVLIEEYGIEGVISKVLRERYSYCWEFILSTVLVYQIYKTMRCFSKSLTAQNTTDWFYENEDNQEEK